MLFFNPWSFSATCSAMYMAVVVPLWTRYKQVVDAMACFSACGKFAFTRQRENEVVGF